MIKSIIKSPIIVILAPITATLFTAKLALVVLFFLILIDLYYGLKKSFKKEELKFNPFKRHFWKTIKSKGLRGTWVKGTQYGTGIIITAMIQATFFPKIAIGIGGITFTPLLFIIMVACLIEAYSILENINEIWPNNRLNKVIEFIKSNKIKEIINIFKGNKVS